MTADTLLTIGAILGGIGALAMCVIVGAARRWER